MNLNQFNSIKNHVMDYFKSSYTKDKFVDENLKLKECHTLNVCERIDEIARSLNLKTKDIYLCKTIALLHDIGRFPQFIKYKTFLDHQSEDHALMGIKLIKEKNLLRNLLNREAETIYTAIQYHNSHIIPININPEHTRFIKIIRDADKLDIFRIQINHYQTRNIKKNRALDLGLSEEKKISKEIINNFFNSKTSSNKIRKTIYDMMLNHIAWAFDLNFKYSIEYIREKQYIETLFSFFPETADKKRLKAHMDDYINSMIK